jgi:hypothetical protein
MDKVKRTVNTVADRLTKTKIECMINEATTNEPWGVATSLLNDIADKMQAVKDGEDGMDLILKKLSSTPKQYNRIYKVLNLIEHLLKLGSARCVTIIRDHAHRLRTFQEFSYRDNGVEKGQGIRDKARIISALLVDHRLLEHEREVAMENRKKFMGISSNDFPGQSSYGYSSHYSNTISKPSYSTPATGTQFDYAPPEIPVVTPSEPYPDLFNTAKKPQAYVKPGAGSAQPQGQSTGSLFQNLQTKPKSQTMNLLDEVSQEPKVEKRTETLPSDIFSTPLESPKIQSKSSLPADLFPSQPASIKSTSSSLPDFNSIPSTQVDIFGNSSQPTKPASSTTLPDFSSLPSTKADIFSTQQSEKRKPNMFEGLQPKKKDDPIISPTQDSKSSALLPDNLFDVSPPQSKQSEAFNIMTQMPQSIYNPPIPSQPQVQPYKPAELDPFASADPQYGVQSRVMIQQPGIYRQPGYVVPQYQVPTATSTTFVQRPQYPAYVAPQATQGVQKIHFNYSDYTGPTITQLQTSPSLMASKPEKEIKPKVGNPKEIESAIMNLDNLSLSLGSSKMLPSEGNSTIDI